MTAKKKCTPDEGITRERIRQLFKYSPETGEFFWRISTSNRVKIGDKAGVKGKLGYIYLSFDNYKLPAHRVVWFYVYGEWPKEFIDHINGVKDDNRLANLRLASASQNACNSRLRSTNTSGYRGVSWSKEKNKWVARIVKDRKQHVLGYFDDKEEARIAYMYAAANIHGRFATY